ncbi:MAG: CDP-glycerol glycerophosphotransferase family protein [Actinomycetes bacterium]
MSADITVVVIVYNDAARLPAAVDSVVAQQLPTGRTLEVIVVDDASTDGSGDGARHLAQTRSTRNCVVRALTLPTNSGGCSRPRNVGIDAAQGRYVMFLDSDDVLPPGACAALLAAAEREAAPVAAGLCIRRHLATGRDERWYRYLYEADDVITDLADRPDQLYDTLSTNKLYLRSYLDEHGLRFPEGLHYEDLLFSTSAYVTAPRIAITAAPVYIWHIADESAPASISHRRFDLRNWADRMEVHRRSDAYLREAGVAAHLQGAKDRKFLNHDLKLFLEDVLTYPPEQRTRLLDLVADYLTEPRPDGLPPVLASAPDAHRPSRLAAFVVAARDLPRVLQAARFYVTGQVDFPVVAGEDDGVRHLRWEARELAGADLDLSDTGWLSAPLSLVPIGAVVTHVALEEPSGELRLTGRLWDVGGRLWSGDPELLLVVRGARGRLRWSRPLSAVKPASPAEPWGFDVRVDLAAVAQALRPVDLALGSGPVLRIEATLQGETRRVRLALDLADRDVLPLDLGTLGTRWAPLLGRSWGLTEQRGVLTLQFPSAAAAVTSTGALVRRARSSGYAGRLRRAARVGAAIARRRPPADLVFRLAQRLPVRPGTALFESHLGRQYSDSPKYVYEALVRSGAPWQVTWSYADTTAGFPASARRVRRGSWRWALALATSEVWVDNQGWPRWVTKRPEQRYLQTWHGTPLKTMGFDEPTFKRGSGADRARLRRMAERWDWFVAPSRYTEERLTSAFGYTGEVLRVGYPRNDRLVRHTPGDVRAVRHRLGLPDGKRIVLYAPTFRDAARKAGTPFSLPLDPAEFARRFPDAILLVRTHYLDEWSAPEGLHDSVRDVSGHHDVTDLMLAADVLVTDYSSVMFDWVTTGRPVVFFPYDYDDYVRDQRGTYFDLLAEAPGPVAMTAPELLDLLALPDAELQTRFAARYRDFVDRYTDYETGHASESAVEAVFGVPAPVADEPPAERRRVVIVANSIDTLGGVQRVGHALAAGFAERGHDVELVGIRHDEPHHDFAVRGYRAWTLYDEGFEPGRRLPSRLNRFDLPRRRQRTRMRREAVRRLSEAITREPGTIVICMQVWAMRWLSGCDLSRVRLVVQSHEDYSASKGLTPASEGSLRYARMDRYYRGADRFLTLTEEDAAAFRADGFQHVEAMPNPLSMEVGPPAALTAPVVLTVGRYDAQKNQAALIDAWALLADRHPGWRLRLVGAGPLEAELRAQVTRLGLDGCVEVAGPSNDVRAELQAAAVFALPSDFEGLPVVVAEAMANGLPVVAFDCGPGLREMVQDGETGLLVDKNDVAGLAGALERLMSDLELRRRLGAAGQVAVQRYDPTVVFERWERLFDELG